MNGHQSKALRRKAVSMLRRGETLSPMLWRMMKRTYQKLPAKMKYYATRNFRKPIGIKSSSMGTIKYLD